ncbi:MAG: hypothetical protein A3B11_00890 [Candidatus Taylorbacteria bacterium RIFCSPLOWO2_01_FULL_44_26]|uniref:Homeodomain phBC6A51-type domain-containing protein n=2 Tax=Parcubacteria group TaxID=1794811 RepID=A0A1G2N8D0_9BACT|nr:MAG: hypothetical protein A2647_01265 [Candidatus Nomurabacteria bacterium RIFCSPHIGHO2_01_FULL_40_24b]OHA31501.1 MAG: hypothetical protein A3B11_00890 [Candidatus Taylorbacteria bacterium RIFCSPLOWO2_01_FULL_44_26]
MNEKGLLKIRGRQKKQKLLVLENLRRFPVIQVVCDKVGISRATYYRWVNESSNFAEAAEQAILEGSQVINDVAEAKLFKAIQAENPTAIIFWLKHRNKNYRVNVHAEAHIGPIERDTLSDDEKERLDKMMWIASQGCLECEKKYEKDMKKLNKKYPEKARDDQKSKELDRILEQNPLKFRNHN